MNDYPCHATIHELNKGQTFEPGMPIRIMVSGGIRKMPQPPALLTAKKLAMKQSDLSVSHAGHGIVLINTSKEGEHHFIIDWVWSKTTQPQNDLLDQHLRDIVGDTDATTKVIFPAVRCEVFGDKKGIRIFKVYVPKVTMNDLLDKYPMALYPWASASLMPRRAPAAIRVDSNSLQFWMKLFQ